MADETPITFREPCFVLFDLDAQGCLTTEFGNLAIFTTRPVADLWASRTKKRIKVMPVMVTPIQEQ